MKHYYKPRFKEHHFPEIPRHIEKEDWSVYHINYHATNDIFIFLFQIFSND